jgi:hypothetical protein
MTMESMTKAEKRAERERQLGAKQLAMPEKKFGVIYADPPWKFEVRSRETGLDRSADNHYPCMTPDEIKAMAPQIDGIAAKDCVLFMWSTMPMLYRALDVMNAWGFVYKSGLCWTKAHMAWDSGFGISTSFCCSAPTARRRAPRRGRSRHHGCIPRRC